MVPTNNAVQPTADPNVKSRPQNDCDSSVRLVMMSRYGRVERLPTGRLATKFSRCSANKARTSSTDNVSDSDRSAEGEDCDGLDTVGAASVR